MKSEALDIGDIKDPIVGDLILFPDEYTLVLDRSTGGVSTYAGPTKVSATDSNAVVVWDNNNKQFYPVRELPHGKKKRIVAPEGFYAILLNPAKNGSHPKSKEADKTDLNVGEKINIIGPADFALFPMQMAEVVRGHKLRHNQYLKCYVYNDEAANEGTAVVKAAKGVDVNIKLDNSITDPEIQEAVNDELKSQDAEEKSQKVSEKHKQYTTGQHFTVRGTDVSFYIPPTGVKVEKGNHGYARDAVTLETLEYCILKDENGVKRYCPGPDVIFPKPTEVFLKDEEDNVKFRRLELTDLCGVHVKTIAPYERGNDVIFDMDMKPFTDKIVPVDMELFITGKTVGSYMPRTEHQIIKYGDNVIHYAIAIEPGDARYVLKRLEGKFEMVRGETVFLPDPRTDVVVRRILTDDECYLMYPDNKEVLEYNRRLRQENDPDATTNGEHEHSAFAVMDSMSDGMDYSSDDGDLMGTQMLSRGITSKRPSQLRKKAGKAQFGDEVQRNQKFTPPREIVLYNKFNIPKIEIWNNYAVQVVNKAGDRRVEVGPQRLLLNYDETFGALNLSTGKPKKAKLSSLKRTGYLRINDNGVSDIITVETSDLCKISFKIQYLINFDPAQKDKWFDIENYVQFCCDHNKSLLQDAISEIDVQTFYSHPLSTCKTIILGKEEETYGKQEFGQNGMFIYDVAVMDIRIHNDRIQDLMIQSRKQAIIADLDIESKKREIEDLEEAEKLDENILEAKEKRDVAQIKFDKDKFDRDQSLADHKISAHATSLAKEADNEKAESEATRDIAAIENERYTAKDTLDVRRKKSFQEIEIQLIEAHAKAEVDKKQAIQPNLIAALQSLANSGELKAFADMMPVELLKDMTLQETIKKLLNGTPIGKAITERWDEAE